MLINTTLADKKRSELLYSYRQIRDTLIEDGCTNWAPIELNCYVDKTTIKLWFYSMLSVHPSSSQDQSNGSLNTSAFRPPFESQQRDFGLFPHPNLETATKVVSSLMSSDARKEGSREDRTAKGTGNRADDEDGDDRHEYKDPRNLTETFVAVIAQAVLSAPSKRMTLSSIYNFIARNFPHFDKEKGPGWRNSVRHNLSSNDCFIKASRAENGKGHYWMIHPKDLPEFAKGNYRRPRKPRRPRCSHTLACATDRSAIGVPLPTSLFPYHGKPSTGLDLNSSSTHRSVYQHSLGLPPRYDYFPLEDSTRYPMNGIHGITGPPPPPPPPPPPYGLFWQDHSVFRNYPHLQASTFHPYLYIS